MEFLTLDGTVTVNVVVISESEPELIGDESRSSDGGLRGVYIAEKRKWNVQPLEMSEADFNTIRNLLALGAQVSAAGDFIGTPTTIRGRIRSANYLRNGTGFLRDVQLELVEV